MIPLLILTEKLKLTQNKKNVAKHFCREQEKGMKCIDGHYEMWGQRSDLKILKGEDGSKPSSRHFSIWWALVWCLLYCRRGFAKIAHQLTTDRPQTYDMRQTRILNINKKVLLRRQSIRALSQVSVWRRLQKSDFKKECQIVISSNLWLFWHLFIMSNFLV